MALLHVHFRSEVLALSTSMDVLLPEKADPPAGGWPTLYLLHGLSDDHTIWQRLTSIERYVLDMPLCVVMPTVHRSFYTDMKHGGNYWTFISDELPAICERMFPLSARRENRYAAGLSMGGYGALKLGLRKPDRYAAVASLSGAVDMGKIDHDDHRQSGTAFYYPAFGTLEEFNGSQNDLCAVARRLIAEGTEPPRIYMACGTEDFLYENNQGFLREFEGPLRITYEEGPGSHTWAFWDAYIQKVLAWLKT